MNTTLYRRVGVACVWSVAVVFVAALPNAALAQKGSATGTPVQVSKPVTRTMVRNLAIPGTLTPDEQVDLYARTSGYVESITVDIGSRVGAGDELARISVPEMADELRQANAVLVARRAKVRAFDATAIQAERNIDTMRAEVQRHAAQYELDKISLKRREELREANAIPQQSLDEARSAHQIAEANLEIAQAKVAGAQAEKQAADADVEVARAHADVGAADVARMETLMSYASIRAPFDGVVTQRRIDHGTYVRSADMGSADPLLRVAKMDRIRLVLQIPEVDVPYIRIGTKVQVVVPALSADAIGATISRTAGALSPETRSMRAEVDLDNSSGRLAPGMYAKVVVELETNAKAMMVPSKAIRSGSTGTMVLVCANGVAHEVAVTTGYDDGIWAEIKGGLEGDEDIITAAGGAVTAGSRVRPIRSDS